MFLRASTRTGARLDGMINASELLINVVIYDKPKMLTGLNQKVRGWLPLLWVEAHGQLQPPANRQDITRPCYLSETR